MTSSFTPGPWKVVDDPAFGAYLTVEAEDGRLICDLGDSDVSADEDAANARLIAASRHMYDALKAIADYPVGIYDRDGILFSAQDILNTLRYVQDMAQAAIAAADGPLGKPKEADDDDAV